MVVTDAICSSADETHDALLRVYRTRFSEQVEAVTTQEVLDSWRWPSSQRETTMKALLRDNGLTIALTAMFVFCGLG